MKTGIFHSVTAFLVMAMFAGLLSGCVGEDGKPIKIDPIEITEGDVMEGGKVHKELRKAWRISGTSQYIDIGETTVALYEETRSLCYLNNASINAAALFETGRTFRSRTDLHKYWADIFNPSHKLSDYTLERIGEIPARCKAAPPQDPATVFRALWEMFDLDYAFFKERNIDWAARYSQLAPKAAVAVGDDALQAVLVEALRDFNDDHVALIREINGAPSYVHIASNTPTVKMLKQAFQAQNEINDYQVYEAFWKSQVEASFAASISEGSSGRVLNGGMVWGKLPGNVGYIELSKMYEYSEGSTEASDLNAINTELDRVLAALAGTRALIVDVSFNEGGYDTVSAEIAGRFADQRRLAFTKRQHRDEGRGTQSWYIEPSNRVKYMKPVYLLTSDRTVSAGDTFTLMMRELPSVTHAGQVTSGSFSDALVKRLPGNFYVSLSNEIYLDPKGNLFEGKGIPPKLPLTLFDPANLASLYTGHAQAIAALLNVIR